MANEQGSWDYTRVVIKCKSCGEVWRPKKFVQADEAIILMLLEMVQYRGLFVDLERRHFAVPPDDAIPCILAGHELTLGEADEPPPGNGHQEVV